MDVVAVRIAIGANIFEVMGKSDGPLTAQQIMEGSKADEDLTGRILRYLASMDAVAEVGSESYELTKIGRAFTSPKGI